MPITLITTVGGSTSDSYISVADADTYFDRRPNATAWTDLTDDDDKAKLLLWAMRSLNGLGWIGGRYSTTQSLDWPRVAVRPIERFTRYSETMYGGGLYDQNGNVWTYQQIPTGVLNAQCELALAIQQNTSLTTPGAYKRRIIKNNNGLLEFGSDSEMASTLMATARRELRGLLFTGAGMIAMARG